MVNKVEYEISHIVGAVKLTELPQVLQDLEKITQLDNIPEATVKSSICIRPGGIEDAYQVFYWDAQGRSASRDAEGGPLSSMRWVTREELYE